MSPTPSQSVIEPPAEDVVEDPSGHKPPDRQTSTGDDSQDYEVCPRLQESIAHIVLVETKRNTVKMPQKPPRKVQTILQIWT